ncbi:MAG: amidohydrolase family protein [Rhizobiaceae bacterium]|nr:amidohydrolase family protein [Rhizobiaceae bacterium]
MYDLDGIRVFDIHHHVGSLGAYFGDRSESTSFSDESIAQDCEARLRYMDKFGISQALLMPANGYAQAAGIADTKKHNDHTAKYRKLMPDRFPVAAGTVSALDGAQGLDEIDRCIDELGFQAMAWHHRFQGSVLDHPMMDAFLEKLQSKGVPAIIHIVTGSTLEAPWRLELLAERHREVTIIALDGFSCPNNAQWMSLIASRHENIIFDTGVLTSAGHSLEKFVKTAGAHRMLLGTDFYTKPKLFSFPFPLAEVLHSDFTHEEKEAILGGNARRLFGVS